MSLARPPRRRGAGGTVKSAGAPPIGMACAEALLRVVPRLVRLGGQRFREVGLPDELHLPQFLALQYLAKGAATAGEVARALGVRPATATEQVDALVARGLVTRDRNPADRREVVVRVTPSGLTTYLQARAILLEHADWLVARLDDTDQQRLTESLGVLDEVLARLAEAEEPPPATASPQ